MPSHESDIFLEYAGKNSSFRIDTTIKMEVFL